MSMSVTGLKELLRNIEDLYGKQRMQTISDKALKKGAAVFVAALKREFLDFKDTGASIEEITLSQPMNVRGVRTIKVHWKGPKGRYRIIHLNEYGTVKNPNPKGKGAVARAMRNAESAYRATIIQAIREGIQ
ncbi:HK97-gp10 family putative phage morphogenesis protein [Metabacillus indicus]|uniref:HK97-gp10 family putative phage morphogenesis protein n=1 Tax=Metabacillus indicus TaxID=246786 RepID=UPI002A060109|nr:HK97-gp10 family putative phage morphogenesis protein [Metabacillus indicus]MDX8288837.1 HK97-gp10 family putative phage morphogenesis protein [Metabacillus indicus]